MNHIVLLLSIIAVFISCSIQQAGTLDDVGAGSVSGHLVTDDNIPVDYPVTVSLYKEKLTTGTAATTGLRKKAADSGNPVRMLTTGDGTYRFDSLSNGEYRILVRDDDINVGEINGISVTGDETETDTLPVKETVSIPLSITGNGSKNLTVANSLIDNCKVTGNDSGYTVKTVKSDTFVFKLVVQQEYAIDTVEVKTTIDETAVHYELLDSSATFTIAATPAVSETGLAEFVFGTRMSSFDITVNGHQYEPVVPELKYGILTLLLPGRDTIRDSLPDPVIHDSLPYSTISNVYRKELVASEWMVRAKFYDTRDSLYGEDSTILSVPPSDSITRSFLIYSHYVRLNAVFLDVPDDISFIRMAINNRAVDSVAINSSVRDTVLLHYDYISRDSSGLDHSITLYARGYDSQSGNNISYRFDTTTSLHLAPDNEFTIDWNVFKEDFHYENLKIPFERTIGTADKELGYSVEPTADGGFIVGGQVIPSDTLATINRQSNFILLKTDGSGTPVWMKTYDAGGWEYGTRALPTNDGGFVLVGTTLPATGFRDIFLLKTDGAGDSLWSVRLGGNNADYGNAIQQTDDGGFIIAGETASFGNGWTDFYLVKTDAAGGLQWSKTFGGSSEEVGTSVIRTSDGGYLIAGDTQNDEQYDNDIFLVKTDANGDSLWSRSITRTTEFSTFDSCTSVWQTNDGGYIIAGITMDNPTVDTLPVPYHILVKTDSEGTTQWTRLLVSSQLGGKTTVQQTTDGGYIVAGTTGGENIDIVLIKTDNTGSTTWSKTFGGNESDECHSVRQIDDGGFVIVGTTSSFGAGKSDIYLIRTDAGGNVE